jgi:hypothetical protein
VGDEYDWLPDLVMLADYNGRWEDYIEALYEVFGNDFVDIQVTLTGEPVELLKGKPYEGKSYSFWYLTHDHPRGREEEAEWVPNLRRCERLGWIIPIIKGYESGRMGVLNWRSHRGEEGRLVIGIDDFSYVVVLAHLENSWLLITHYFVEREHRREKLRREYEAYIKDQRRP